MKIIKTLKQKRRKWFGPSYTEIKEEWQSQMSKSMKKLFYLECKKYKKMGYDDYTSKQLALRDTKLVVTGGAVKAGIPVSKKAIKDLEIKKW